MRRIGALVGGLLILVAACGDDGAKESIGRSDRAGDDAGEPATGGETDAIDVCTLLEKSDVEVEFGDLGPVDDGYHDLFTTVCAWEVGGFATDPSADGGTVRLEHLHEMFDPVEQQFEVYRGIGKDPVDVAGVGDDAFYEYREDGTALVTGHGILTFRSGELIFEMSAVFLPPIERIEPRLVSLAQVVVDRV